MNVSWAGNFAAEQAFQAFISKDHDIFEVSKITSILQRACYYQAKNATVAKYFHKMNGMS